MAIMMSLSFLVLEAVVAVDLIITDRMHPFILLTIGVATVPCVLIIADDDEEMRRVLFIAALLVSFVSAYGETYSGDGIVLKLEGDSIWVNET